MRSLMAELVGTDDSEATQVGPSAARLCGCNPRSRDLMIARLAGHLHRRLDQTDQARSTDRIGAEATA